MTSTPDFETKNPGFWNPFCYQLCYFLSLGVQVSNWSHCLPSWFLYKSVLPSAETHLLIVLNPSVVWVGIQGPQDLALVYVSCFIWHHSPVGDFTLHNGLLCSLNHVKLTAGLCTCSSLCLECSAPRTSVTPSFFLVKSQFKCHFLTLTSEVQFSPQILSVTERCVFLSQHIPQSSIILIIYLFVYCLSPIENANFLRTGTPCLLFTMGNSGIVSVKDIYNKYLLNKWMKNEAL